MNSLIQPRDPGISPGILGQLQRILAYSKRINLLGRLIPTDPSRRRTLNLLLMAGVVAPLLLALALVSIFKPSTPADQPVELTAAQTAQVLEGVMERHARTVVSMAADSVLGTAGRGPEATYRRLSDFLTVFSDFEGFAVVDRQGKIMASAGVLPPNFSLWREVPAFQDSLEHPDTPAISSLKSGDMPWQEVDGASVSSSQIDRMVFAAAIRDPNNPTPATRALLGVMKTETLLDSVQVLLYGSGPEYRDVAGGRAQQPEDSPDQVSSGPNLWLASVSFQAPATTDLRQVIGPIRSNVTENLNQVYRPIFSSQESGEPWYLVVQRPSPADTGKPLLSTFNLAVTGGAVALVVIAGGVIWRSGPAKPATPSPVQIQYPLASVTPWFGDPPKEISRRVIAVQESVRREMHVQSKLLALSLSLGMCRQALDRDPTGASQMLERVQTELQKVQDEDLRQVSRELYPAIIKFGLVPAMRSLVSRFNESVEIDLTIDPRIGALDLAGEAGIPEKQRLGVYRIAEEALNNILKHADATNVRLSLDWQEPEHLTMSVVDNGRGFDLGRRSASHGLVMMTDYAQAMGGKAEIISSPGQGTSVRLALSLGSWEMAIPLEIRVN